MDEQIKNELNNLRHLVNEVKRGNQNLNTRLDELIQGITEWSTKIDRRLTNLEKKVEDLKN